MQLTDKYYLQFLLVIAIAMLTILSVSNINQIYKKAMASEVIYLEALPPTTEQVKEEIVLQAQQFGLDANKMLSIAQCESEYVWNAKNPNSTARGVYQYLIGTWEETESAKEGLERNNYKANIREAMIDVANGEDWRWSECL